MMATQNYLQWIAEATNTSWWHDSAEPAEIEAARANGAVGVTTNPVLVARTLTESADRWRDRVRPLLERSAGLDRPEALTAAVVRSAAGQLAPVHAATGGAHGYVCAQVDPAAAADREGMAAMARRLSAAAPNIAVKLPVTAAGLDALEECVAQGITVTATVSFTVAQVLAVAKRHAAGIARAKALGIAPGRCFAVIMIGRIDDYLRDVARDCRAPLEERELCQAGLTIVKRAHRALEQSGSATTLMVAAMRNAEHVTGLVGGELILSIHPRYQRLLLEAEPPRERGIDAEVDRGVVERLCGLEEFVRAYEPDGMEPEEFIRFGVTQRTLSQFSEAGWVPLQAYRVTD